MEGMFGEILVALIAFTGFGFSRRVSVRRRHDSDAVTRENRYLNLLHEMARGLLSRQDEREILQGLADRLATLAGIPNAFIFLLNRETDRMERRYGAGVHHLLAGDSYSRGEAVVGQTWAKEEPVIIPDYRVWQERNPDPMFDRFTTVVGVPLKRRGTVVGVIGLNYLDTVQDITDSQVNYLRNCAELVSIALDNADLFRQAQDEILYRREVEEALCLSREQFRRSILLAPFPCFIHTEDGRIALISREMSAAAGEDGGLVTVENLAERLFIDPDGLINTLKRAREAADRVGHGEFKVRLQDSTERTWEMHSTPLGHFGGYRQAVMTAAIDVTERKLAEEERVAIMEKTARMERMVSLGTMVASVAHEISQPLQAITVSVDSALFWEERGKPLTPGQMVQQFRRLSSQAARIERIVQRLRDFARPAPATLDSINVNDAVLSALDLVGRQLAGHGIEVETALSEGLPPIMGDACRIDEAVINILINGMQAMDAMRGPGRKAFVIATGAVGDSVHVEISNNGPPIDPEVIGHIFEPFYTTRQLAEGMGLGLHVVRSVAEQHGGTVDAVNYPGGVTFRMTFPASLPAHG